MKKLIIYFLLLALLLSGCDIASGITDKLAGSIAGGESSSHTGNASAPGNPQTLEINRKTGVELHDKAPDLAEVGIDEYLAYFENSGEMVDMGEFDDPRNPYEARLAADKEALGKNFEEYYLDQANMVAYFENFVEKHLDAYNEDKGLGDSVYLYLIAFQSMELAMGSSFTEEDDWAMLQKGMVMAAEMFGGSNATVTRNAAHNYTITYTDDSGAEVVDHFRADLGGGIQMLSYSDGTLSSFFEFRELGNDTYVWQNGRERMVMTCRDKTVHACWYSNLNDDAPRYGEDDLIFGTEGGFDSAWVLERDDFRTEISFDGKLLDVTTINFFFGGVGHAEITVGES